MDIRLRQRAGAGMMPPMRLIIALLAILIAAPPAGAAEKFKPGDVIEGTAFAMDGDTLGFIRPDGAQLSVRLWGIDAPEMTDTSGAGWAARKTMDSLLVWQPVACRVVDTDKYKRPVAICANDPNGDLARQLILAGWAVEYRKYTRPPPVPELAATAETYAEAERDAEHARRGRWKWIFGN